MGTDFKVQVQDPGNRSFNVQTYDRHITGSNRNFSTQVHNQNTSLNHQNIGNNQEGFRHNQCGEDNQDTAIYHNHSENLTPSSLDNNSPTTMLDLNNMESKDIIMAGYNDCTEEAIRYLTEVESIPLDDPIIVGLRDHLSEKQRYLDYTEILHQLEQEIETGSTIDSDTNETTNLRYYSNTHDFLSDEHQNHQNDICSVSHNTDYTEVEQCNINRDSTNDIMETSYADDSCSIDGSECSLTSINFALLVQNNPDIAHLTDELLYLLEGAPEQIMDEV